MIKFISKIIGVKILTFQERMLAGEVTRVLVEPKDGSFVGLEVLGQDRKEPKYVPSSEIKGFSKDLVLIKSVESLSSAEDVVNIKSVLASGVEILKSRVYYEDGRYLGKVEDATIDVKILSLEKLYVNPKLSAKLFSQYLTIPEKMIISIEPKKIIIKDDRPRSYKEKMVAAISPISE